MKRKYPRKKLIKLRKLQSYFFLATHHYTMTQPIMRTYPLTNDTLPLPHLPIIEGDSEVLPGPDMGIGGDYVIPDLIWYPRYSSISLFTKRYAGVMWAYQVRNITCLPEIWYDDFVPFNPSVYFKATDLDPLQVQINRYFSKEPTFPSVFSSYFVMLSGRVVDAKSYYLNEMSNIYNANFLNPHSRDFLFLIPLTAARLLSTFYKPRLYPELNPCDSRFVSFTGFSFFSKLEIYLDSLLYHCVNRFVISTYFLLFDFNTLNEVFYICLVKFPLI